MPQTTYEKNRYPRAYVYDSLLMMDVDAFTVTASQANTAVQSYTPLPVNIKIIGMCVVASSSANGATAFNIVLGTGAETGLGTPDNSEIVGYPPVTAAPGNSVFAVDKPITLVAGVPQTFAADLPDVIWPKGGLITARYVTGASVAGIIKCKMLIKIVDTKPFLPGEVNRPIQFSDL